MSTDGAFFVFLGDAMSFLSAMSGRQFRLHDLNVRKWSTPTSDVTFSLV